MKTNETITWRLEYMGTHLLIWEGNVLLGTINDPLLPIPVAEELSVEGTATVNITMEL